MLTVKEAKEAACSNTGSLEDLCKRAICTADINLMAALGFPEKASKKICSVILSEAKEIGIEDLDEHYKQSLENNWPSIINRIVQNKHRLYFATRASLPPHKLLEYLVQNKSDLCEILYEISNSCCEKTKQSRRQKCMIKASRRVRNSVRMSVMETMKRESNVR